MHTRFFLILVVTLRCIPLNAQNYTMDGTAINDCSGTFFDPGGETGNYGNNQNITTTICSDGSTGTHIRLSFSGADIAPGDQLCIYDGVNLAAPLLACHTDYTPGQPFLIQATATNPSGCLTVNFVSDGSGTGTGWAAAISCVASCQTIQADLVSTNPAAMPVDTGWIDICPGDRVFFNGKGVYPQNNFAYAQSDLTTTFEWNFGDGGIAYGPNTSHRFDKPGGYYVQLVLTDTMGCKNTNLIDQRIRVAARPDFQLNGTLDQTICAGDTIQLSASTQGSSNTSLTVVPDTASFQVEGSRSDSLALPDGTGIPYETSIFFTEFSPGQVLTSASDLEAICVNMEHSWARDVEISLTCPNGQSITLHNHPGNFGGEVLLGEPNDNDNVNPIPGVGYDYCWTNNAPNPTWLDYANNVLGGAGTLPPGDYTPFEPISDLVGCPLNGDWTIRVIDWWPIDNGFIFNWSLKFKDALYPSIEQFSPQFLSWEWNDHPSIFYSSPDSIAASPQNAGTAGYTFTVHDEFGCTWDTLLTVNVLPPTHPDCHTCAQVAPVLKDTTICSGGSAVLNGATLAPPDQIVHFEAYPDYKLGNGNHPHANPYFSPLNVNSLGYNLLTIPTQQITEVCMDIETDYDSDLNIYLQAPSGQLLELSTGNGGSGNDYKITCFSPTAVTPIIGQSAPFNGTYKPEGNWNILQGAAVNGNWSLRVSDGFAPNQYGKVKWWSIGFKVNNNVTYSWSNAATLSCNNCPNPTATPTADTEYTLLAQDAFGCTYRDTVAVTVLTAVPAPTGLAISTLGGGAMTWAWNAVPGALGYEVSVDGGPWQPANGMLSHTISGLSIGQAVTIDVRAISPGCNPLPAHGSGNYLNCSVMALLDAIGPVQCAADSSGSVDIAAAGGDPPYTFFVDNWPGSFPSGTLNNIFPEGNHAVIVQDANGCADTVQFVINGPPPLAANLGSSPTLCHGDNTGSVQATASGGSAPFSYLWQPCSGGPGQAGSSITGLAAGCYALTVTDDNGCQLSDTISVGDAPVFVLQTQATSVSCNSLSDGQATVTATGATPPYTYVWDNGQTAANATVLNGGLHTITVTDAALCQDTAQVFISEPAALVADSVHTQAVSCSGNGSAEVYISGGTPPYTYHWSNGVSASQANNLTAGTYTVTVTDAAGCSLSAEASVLQPANDIALIVNQLQAACYGETNGKAQAVASGGNGAPFTYMWNNGAQTDTVSNLAPGNYAVTVSDQAGCTASQQVQIQELEKVTVNVAFVPPVCFGASDGKAAVNLISGGIGMMDSSLYHYYWSVPGSADNSHLNGITGGQLYSLTVSDFQGCSGTYSFFVNQPPAITFNKLIQPVSCFGLADGAITLSNVMNATGAVNYAWSNAANTMQISQLSGGTYTVTMSDSKGCQIMDTFKVQEPAQLMLHFNVQPLVCAGDSNAVLSAVVNGGTPGYQYLWNTGSTNTAINNLPPGAYQVTITDANGCTIDSSETIAPPNALNIGIENTDPACFGSKNGMIKLNVGGGAPPYHYSLNGGVTTGSNAFLALPAGIYSIAVQDGNGCVSNFLDTLNQPPLISVALPADTTILLGDSLLILAIASNTVGMPHFTWTSNLVDTFNCLTPAFCEEIVVRPSLSNIYHVAVSDENGCTGTAAISVTVNKPRGIYVPTAFSPNGDLTNDLLVVHGLSRQIKEVISFSVYDRWGELLYQNQHFPVNNLSVGWNGQFRGQDCLPGVYVWMLEAEYIDGHRESLYGNVTLVR